MKRNSIGFLVIMAVFSVLGILLVQFFFLKNSHDLNEQQFHQLATSALRNVASQIHEYNDKVYHRRSRPMQAGQVEQISNNYYVVNVNDVIDSNLLEHFLTIEFKKRNLNITFEYAIYDCNTKKMVHGNTLKKDSINFFPKLKKKAESSSCSEEELMYEKNCGSTSAKDNSHTPVCDFPTCEKFTYYFGVYFPDRSQFYASRLLTWYILNGILFFIVIFFGYALYVIIKQRQLSEIQKNFINNLTHEFKTPISSIGLAAKVLSNPKIIEQPDRLAEYVQIVGQQNKRLSAHVEKLLQMATIEKTKMHLNLERIELNLFIKESVHEFRNSQNGKNYHVQIEPSSEDSFVVADKLHFSNLIFNILDNAIKYCSVEPEILIQIKTSRRYYWVVFEDNGIGIPKDHRRKIFNRFYRVPTGNIHDVKGFGLGLDYVRKIVRRHGWNIRVVENSKKGTTFILKIKKLKS